MKKPFILSRAEKPDTTFVVHCAAYIRAIDNGETVEQFLTRMPFLRDSMGAIQQAVRLAGPGEFLPLHYRDAEGRDMWSFLFFLEPDGRVSDERDTTLGFAGKAQVADKMTQTTVALQRRLRVMALTKAATVLAALTKSMTDDGAKKELTSLAEVVREVADEMAGV